MKKKVLIIIGIIITLLVIIGIITGIEDKSRIEKMEEPKYTIKLVNGESGKITYLGLGYIIVRDTAVSPNESFASSLRVKFRGWFMRYDFFRNNENQNIKYITNNDELYNFAINHLIDNDDSQYKNENNYKMFTNYKGFGIVEDDNYKYAYMWIHTESYYVKNNEIVFASGSSMPYKFIFNKNDNSIIKYENPKDGSEYADSIKSMFPEDIANEIINYGVSNEILKKKVQEYYSELETEKEKNDTSNIMETTIKPINNNIVVESNLTQTETLENETKPTGDFKIIFNSSGSGNNINTILDKSETDKYDYSIYAYMGSVNIIIDGTEYSLKDALKSNKITMEKIIEKAKKDIPDAIVYRDGGTTVYHYENYTIIKVNKVDGNRDVYIGTKDMTLNDVL